MNTSKNSDETNAFYAHLYDEPSTENLDLPKLMDYLKDKSISKKIDVREPIIKNYEGSMEALAGKFAKARVHNLKAPKMEFEPLLGEIRFEEKLIQDPTKKVSGILYDGPSLMEVFHELLPEGEDDLSHLHVIFTNRLFGTWSQVDRRYHARVSIYGFPSLISTTGIVEAPAKPKKFYQLKRQYAAMGQKVPLEVLKEKFRGKFIDYDDERLTEVMKGYLMQAVFHHLGFDPFCHDVTCKLHNSHWQEEVIKSKLRPTETEFCNHHREMLDKIRRKFGKGD